MVPTVSGIGPNAVKPKARGVGTRPLRLVFCRNHQDPFHRHDFPKRAPSKLPTLRENPAVEIAHRITNPLAGLSATLHRTVVDLSTKDLDVPVMRAKVEGALREVGRLAGLLKDLRSVALAQALDLQLTDLGKLVRETLFLENAAYRSAGIRVKIDIENGLPPVALDATEMRQAVRNLCNNAVEAMPNGGCLTIKVYRVAATVVVEITDDGDGVARGLDVFELFRTTKAVGGGLGLPVVQQIVSAHNGTIDYTSRAGHGTTFTVSLPIPPVRVN